MANSWTMTQFIAVAGLAVLDIVVGLAASAITVATGITMTSGFITSFSEPLILVVCLLTVNRKGAAILFMAIVSVLALPIVYAGPAGFLPKIPIILILGMICEVLYQSLKKISVTLSAVMIGGVLCLWYVFAVAVVARFLSIPGLDNFLRVMPLIPMVVLVFASGGVGGILGVLVHNRIRGTAIVTRINQGR